MSKVDCEACSNLVEYAPNFVQNGVTSKVCNSLKNDTGFNPDLSSLHNNCEDLNDANDCLIGRKDDQLEAYDVCDWKEFMHLLLPNMYELNKAMICSDCGQWKDIHDIYNRLDELCSMIDNSFAPRVARYGHLPYNEDPNRVFGIKGNMVEVRPREVVSQYFYDQVGIGIMYAKQTYSACSSSGKDMVYEWILPSIYDVDALTTLTQGDVVWKATKAQLQNAMGFSEYLWYSLVISTVTWFDFQFNTDRRFARFSFHVDDNEQYLELTYQGSSYPNDGSVPMVKQRINGLQAQNARLYRHAADWVRPD